MAVKKVKPKKYYAKGMQHVIKLRAVEDDGSPAFQKRADGSYMLNNNTGKKIPLMYTVEFEPYLVDPKKDMWCVYSTIDQNEIEQLNLKSKERMSPILTEAEYERGKAPEAYDLAQENAELKVKLEELLSKTKALEASSKK